MWKRHCNAAPPPYESKPEHHLAGERRNETWRMSRVASELSWHGQERLLAARHEAVNNNQMLNGPPARYNKPTWQTARTDHQGRFWCVTANLLQHLMRFATASLGWRTEANTKTHQYTGYTIQKPIKDNNPRVPKVTACLWSFYFGVNKCRS